MGHHREHQNLKTLSQFVRSQFLKKLIQLFVSVSVFSFLLSNSSRLSFLCSFNFHFSKFPLQLFSHTIDKNCIFLLCNGLLVFVAKYSGLISSCSKYENPSVVSFRSFEDGMQTLELESKGRFLRTVEYQENDVYNMVQGTDDEGVNGLQLEDKEKREFIVEVEEEEEEKEKEDGVYGVLMCEAFLTEDGNDEGHLNDLDGEVDVQEAEEQERYESEDDDDEEEEENWELSTEELNKKFDEFIRRMKEEIRIEAQQQLVMVN
ncbi:hypothetical protein K2173_023816 [Erythroxylum novogranatense]|uniref:Uncharacterized protein n=1 Tax=Erythroxylum novogranatense TaxID=1862640 RepID=A0AAV8TK84_9ROSI|nr:hypothetical protein K2173_023816 [Erythroxylum novogranatense]